MKFYATSKLSENILTTPEGYLICIGVPVGRVGEMDYADGETPVAADSNGRVKIIRKAEEVFKPETLKSFEGKPVTITHPDGMVDPSNWNKLAKGIMQNVRRGEGEWAEDIIADLLITSADAIQLVKEGLREVSCGYDADYYQLEIGLGEQKNIIGNHLALVTQGRAGSSYAIHDHKGKGSTMKLTDKIKAIFSKAQDEAIRAAVGDEAAPEKKEDAPSKDAGSYDELCKAVKDLGEKVAALGKPKDAQMSQPSEGKPAAPVGDQPAPVAVSGAAPSMDERMKKVEDALASLLAPKDAAAGDEEKIEMEKKTGDEEVEVEETSDAESEEEEKGEKKSTGDSLDADLFDDSDGEEEEGDTDLISRAEILAPGIKKDQKNLKAKALKMAYGTSDGKAVIDQFTGGKAPDLKNEKWVDAVFVGASQVLKFKRTDALSKTKTFDFAAASSNEGGHMTPEKLNEINAKHYAKK